MTRSLARSLSLAVAVVGATVALGCTVTVKTQTKFRPAAPVTGSSQAAWTAQAIEIENANGGVRIVGDASATKVTFSTFPFAFADTQTDGDAAVADVQGRIAIDETADRIYVHCSTASKSYGTAANGTTGCDDLTVTVPAGSLSAGLKLKAVSHNGSVSAQNLTAAAGQQLLILSDNGSVTASNITGSVRAHTDNGSVDASFTPTGGAQCEASSGNGDVTLSLPADFSADALALSAKGGVVINGFSDLTAASTSRGQPGNGAARIVASTDNGKVTINAR